MQHINMVSSLQTLVKGVGARQEPGEQDLAEGPILMLSSDRLKDLNQCTEQRRVQPADQIRSEGQR